MAVIDAFQGAHRFLSNFWPAEVTLDGERYRSVEHAYVAAKTLDANVRAEVRKLPRPGDVKRFGRSFPVRPDWDSVKLDVMRDLVAQKFANPDLKRALLDTGDAELVEGNTWGDVFWGVCRGRGANHLGRILMAVRDELRRPA